MTGIVQYIIVRSDLRSELNWSVGAVIAQCCHATAAVLAQHPNDDSVKKYLDDLDNMHKVVLQVKDEAELVQMSSNLKNNAIEHALWIERPEGIPTCIAVKPYFKDVIYKYVKHLKILK